MINESEYAHQALSDVIPLRDLFGMVFFVSVGMLLDPSVVWRQIGTLGIVVVAVIAGKAAIFAVIVRLFGYRRVVPLAVGLTLFQVGEFAFVLARTGRSGGFISGDLYALVLNTAVATMALTPIVSGTTPFIYERIARRKAQEPLEALNLPDRGLSGHIVVSGAGRVGRTIADALAHRRLPFVLIDFDDRRVQDARVAVRRDLRRRQPRSGSRAAALERSRALIVTVPDIRCSGDHHVGTGSPRRRSWPEPMVRMPCATCARSGSTRSRRRNSRRPSR